MRPEKRDAPHRPGACGDASRVPGSAWREPGTLKTVLMSAALIVVSIVLAGVLSIVALSAP